MMDSIQIPDWMLKLMVAFMSIVFTVVIWISKTAWGIAKKIGDLENEHINHVVDDTRRFDLIGEKLDDQKLTFTKISDSHNEINVALKSLIAASEVHEKMINQRFDDIQSQLREFRRA